MKTQKTMDQAWSETIQTIIDSGDFSSDINSPAWNATIQFLSDTGSKCSNDETQRALVEDLCLHAQILYEEQEGCTLEEGDIQYDAMNGN